MRHRVRQVAVPAADERPSLADREAGKPLRRRELEADERRLEPVHGGATQRASLSVEEVAVRRICLEELRDLVDEPLEHGGQIELTAQYLGGP